MNADEPRLGFDEIELDVPAAALQHMDLDGRHGVVRATAVVAAVASIDDIDDFACADLPDGQQILDLDITP
ncbi:hypothetical protein [Pseudomonas sp. NMI760_13]|uniref:hypothetical protein n=1 Tax=Pseudomonas sp. NMI760_13 TaxID=2903147 RepID=UPI001E2FA978|nr:hypothetical protein [Pseudomonas sp. NMI760_13]MCE0915173.1 hypothetical protein [Pseudomonas sp. NMI760_13]